MPVDKNFLTALALSLAAHTAIFINYSGAAQNPFQKKPVMMRVNYVKDPPQLTQEQKLFIEKKMLLAKQGGAPPAALSKEKLAPPAHKDGLLARSAAPNKESALVKPSLARPDIIAVKKKITLPAIDLEKINNPTYVSYYQFVREKIRRAAYQHYTRTETGEVYLAFVISSEGALKDVRFLDDRSAPNSYLRDIALRSIRGAAPFPPFPKDLDYPQLSFNVIISFEIE